MPLPLPEDEALEHSSHLAARIVDEIRSAQGRISFARFMELALYAPGLGYYTAGARKFGAAGDFVTAPEMTGLFGQALAAQVAQIMAASAPRVIEVGAGSGRLAADVLLSLEAMHALPVRYEILELSPDLQARQRETLSRAVPHLLNRVGWLDGLPATFSGVVLANELLDAIPVHGVAWREGGIVERCVSLDERGSFAWSERPATGELRQAAEDIAAACAPEPGYETEIGLAAQAWVREWGGRLVRGALLLLDYGFPQHEFYHPQRRGGTLMCHYRHHAHPDPFYLPGLQDITAHVDFTAIALSGHLAGLKLLGYTDQAKFLLNCGILDRLAAMPQGTPDYVRAAGAVSRLLMPHEMGELFKVIALGRGLEDTLLGFAGCDRRHRL